MSTENKETPAAGKRSERRKKLFLAAALVLILAVIGGEALYRYLRQPSRLLKQPGAGLEGIDRENEVAQDFDHDTINIVLLGFDRTASRDRYYRIYRPDTLMVVSLNFNSRQAAVVSIPRDSYVKIAGTDLHDRINAAYMYGHDLLAAGAERHQSGINTVLSTIQDFLGGVPLHYYLALDMDAVVEIVDKLGGIEFKVDVAVREPGDNRLLLDPGWQELSGRDFLNYICFRGVGGDYGRIERQQKIVLETFRQLRENGRLAGLPKLLQGLNATMETNLSALQMASLALFGKEMDPEGIRLYAFPGSPGLAVQGGHDVFYLVINEKARIELIKTAFGVEPAPREEAALPENDPGNRPGAEAGPVLSEEPPSEAELLPRE